MEIARGSTPDIVVKIPDKTIVLIEEADEAYISFWCSGMPVLTKKLSEGDVEIDSEHNCLVCTLSQEDTLAMKGTEGKIQAKILTDGGKVLVSQQSEFTVLPVLNKEVMQCE